MTLCAGSCERVLDPNDRSVMHEITGWIKTRPRGTGGVHAISFRKETGRLLCIACQRKMRDTGTAEQGTLL